MICRLQFVVFNIYKESVNLDKNINSYKKKINKTLII